MNRSQSKIRHMQQTNILLEQRRIRLTEEEVTTKTTTIPITTDTTTVQQNNVAIAKNNYEKNYRATLVKYLSDSLTKTNSQPPSKETINGIKTILNDENFKYISLLTAADFPNVSKDFLPFKMFKKQIGMDDVKKLINGKEVNGIKIADSFVIR